MRVVIEINDNGDLLIDASPDITLMQCIAMLELSKGTIISQKLNKEKSANEELDTIVPNV